MSIRVTVADDHRFMRDGLRQLLQAQPDIEVVAEAEDGERAVEAARRWKPDVVVMDLIMPRVNGTEATRQIVAGGRRVKVLALSTHSDRRFIAGMLDAGASGTFSRTAPPRSSLERSGQRPLARRVSARALAAAVSPGRMDIPRVAHACHVRSGGNRRESGESP